MSIVPPVVAATGPQATRVAHTRAVSSLMYACQQGDVDRVRRILQAQPTAHERRDRTGKTALHYCCTSDNKFAAQAADLLVMAAPDLVETRDEDGFTPLHLAVIAGNMPLVTFLLANNADVNAVDSEQHTVVHWASVCGETGALRAVLSAGAPVSTPDVHGGYPLHYAAQMCGGDKDSNLGLQVLQTLLQHPDIKVTVADGDGRQPLLWAASAGSAKAVLALIRAGATVDAPDKDGLTALHCAASRGHTDCIDTLLTLCGMSPDVIDSNGCTALHYAVTLGHTEATALLLSHGADPNRQDRKGRSPAHCGCAKGQFETVKMLGAQDANLWLRNARGDLPLHEAAASGRRDLVKWLLEARPSQVNARNNDGRCPLHLAALNDNSDMCKILLDAGAQVNPVLRTSKNIFMTPLECALQRGFRSTAKYLQLHGGVPASRIGSSIPGAPSIPNGGLHLKMREDPTSDSERENGDKKEEKVRRKHRRKFVQQSEKARICSPERKSDEKKNAINTEEEPSKDGVTYNSEVKITNNYGGINIERNGDIIISDGSPFIKSMKKQKLTNAENKMDIEGEEKEDEKVEATVVSKEEEGIKIVEVNKNEVEKATVKEEAVNKENLDSDANNNSQIHTVVESVQKSLEDIQSAKATTAIDENIEEIKSLANTIEQTAKSITKEVESIQQNLQQPDQQSLKSNTSVEETTEETHQDLLVEAAIHEPPKSKTETPRERRSFKRQDTMREKEEAAETEHFEKTEPVNVQIEEETNEEKLANIVKIEETQLQVESKVEESAIAVEEEPKETEAGEFKIEKEKVEEMKTTAQDELSTAEIGKPKETEAGESKIEKEKVVEMKVTAQDELSTEEIEKPKEIQDTLPLIETESIVDALSKTKQFDENDEKIEDSISETTMPIEAQREEEVKENSQLQYENEDIKEIATPSEEGKAIVVPIEIAGSSEESKVKQVAAPPQEIKKASPGGVTAVNFENRDEQSAPKEKKTFVKRKKISPPKNGKKDASPKIVEVERPLKKDKVAKIKEAEVPMMKKRSKEKVPTKAIEKIIEVTDGTTENRRRNNLSASSLEESDESSETLQKEHRSFTVLDNSDNKRAMRKTRFLKKARSRSDESKFKDTRKRSKIPTPIGGVVETRIPSLPNLLQKPSPRSASNLSAPLRPTVYSDNERSASDAEETTRRRRLRKRIKTRDSRSAGSDYESSNLIDSGFEPSPRSTRIPKWKNMSQRGVNMTSITQTIQSNIRRYHLERKIFQHLLELKRLQIRSGQHNEAVLVKRAIDDYHTSCAATVGAGRYVPQDYSFKSFEKFLYHSLRSLQKNGSEHLKGLPESPDNPLLCTQSTHRCLHATHAYTGIPCAAYLPRMDHHTIPKIGYSCKPSGFLPHINPKKAVTLELCHGNDKQVISLPTDRLDQNKRYYVTFTVKGQEHSTISDGDDSKLEAHRHAKSV